MLVRAVVACVFLWTSMSAPGAAASSRAWLEVRFFSAGHGDAALLSTSEDRHVLIDAGRSAVGDDLTRRRLLPFLEARRIRSLDAFFVSHPHWDHFGNPLGLYREIPYGACYLNADGDRVLGGLLRRRGVPVRVVARGERLRLGHLEIEVLHPGRRAPATSREPRPSMTEENNRSLVLLVRFGAVRFLFTGDLRDGGEEDVLHGPFAGALRADVLKLGHHGLGSTTAPWLDAVRPRYAVASCGDYDGRWRAPIADLVKRLRKRRVKLLRTDRHGDIVFRTDGRSLSVRYYPALSYRPHAGGPWEAEAPRRATHGERD